MLTRLRTAAHKIAGFLTRRKMENDFHQEIESDVCSVAAGDTGGSGGGAEVRMRRRSGDRVIARDRVIGLGRG
jgi:hypothetical protein